MTAVPTQARRRRTMALVGVAVLAGVVLLTWSQPWFTLVVDGESATASGDVTAGALLPLALAALALVPALALAGRFFRVLLAILQSLLGVCVVAVTAFALAEPVIAVSSVLTDLTGVTGEASMAALATAVTPGAWPFAAAVAGLAQVVLGIVIAAGAHRWPASRRRFERTRLAAAEPDDAIAEWDALSSGEDPTEPGR